MRFSIRNRKFMKPILTAALLFIILGAVTACEAMGYPPPSTPEEKPKPEEVAPATSIRTKDSAIITVYQHLLSQAESQEAKLYLADFYANCDNWTAESEFFKDGSGTWHITVDMSAVENWQLRPYWQQASWFVFRDGTVMPSNRLQANALRIEADLQELSPKEKPETVQES